ncbi:hypothetical protein EMGBS2_00830, partial [Actinomycetota bacterium]
ISPAFGVKVRTVILAFLLKDFPIGSFPTGSRLP